MPASKLEALQTKATADAQWPLAAAIQLLRADETNLDLQINALGALHECGALRNRLAPWWQLWRADPAAWTARCTARLHKADRDYWAVAALLGLDIRHVWPVFKKAGYRILSVRAVPPLINPLTHYATLSLSKGGDLWTPVIELGWDAKTGEINDVARLRAVIFDEIAKHEGSLIGKGDGSNYLRAALPYGTWRVESMPFELVAEAVIPLAKTLLKNG